MKIGVKEKYRVMNLAKGGYNTFNEFKTIKDYGIKYNPEIIIVQFYINDLPDNSFKLHQRLHTFMPPKIHSFCEKNFYSYQYYVMIYNFLKEKLGLKKIMN